MYDKRPRLDPSCYIGFRRYFLTFCTDRAHHAFMDGAHVEGVWSQFLRAACERNFAILAYVFMPDHVHLLVEGTSERSDLQSFASLSKQYSAFWYKQAVGRRLWQPSFNDRVLRDEEATWDVIVYICANPLRRRLVSTCRDYQFLGSGTMTRDELLEELSVRSTGAWQP